MDIVLGAAYGYQPGQVKIFLRSLAEVAPECVPVLMADSKLKKAEAVLRGWHPRVRVVRFPDEFWRGVLDPTKWRWQWGKLCLSCRSFAARQRERILREYLRKSASESPSSRLSPKHMALLHVSLARYYYASQVMRQWPQARRIVVADVRDVFFQRNPFEMVGGKAVFGEEYGPVKMSTYNQDWIRDVAGEEVLERLWETPIICCGVYLGPAEEIHAFLEAFKTEIPPRFEVLHSRFGIDQGIHNAMLRGEWRERCRVEPFGGETMMNLSLTPWDAMDFDPQEGVRHADGGPVAIVHQYDRHPELAAWAQERWG